MFEEMTNEELKKVDGGSIIEYIAKTIALLEISPILLGAACFGREGLEFGLELIDYILFDL